MEPVYLAPAAEWSNPRAPVRRALFSGLAGRPGEVVGAAGFKPGTTTVSVPLDDPKTYQMLRAGRTTGVFQFESALATDMLRAIRCDSFDDLVASNALMRPRKSSAIESKNSSVFLMRSLEGAAFIRLSQIDARPSVDWDGEVECHQGRLVVSTPSPGR